MPQATGGSAEETRVTRITIAPDDKRSMHRGWQAAPLECEQDTLSPRVGCDRALRSYDKVGQLDLSWFPLRVGLATVAEVVSLGPQRDSSTFLVVSTSAKRSIRCASNPALPSIQPPLIT